MHLEHNGNALDTLETVAADLAYDTLGTFHIHLTAAANPRL